MICQTSVFDESRLHQILFDGFVMFIHITLHTQFEQIVPVKTQVSVLNMLYLLKNNNRGDDQCDGHSELSHYQPFSDPCSAATFYFDSF